ncbi:MAG: hypothetical protein ACM37W_14920 [Actinomycetota bacterium]
MDKLEQRLGSQAMSDFNSHKIEETLNWMRLLPYAAFGILAFSLTSAADLNYFVKAYLVLLEAQAMMALIYFLRPKLTKSSKRPSDW